MYICHVKDLMRHIATLFLTLCILLGSVGVAFSEKVCNLVCSNPVAAPHPDSCCEKPLPSTENEADNCCVEEMSFEKLQPVPVQKAFKLDVPVFFPLAASVFLPPWIAGKSNNQCTLTFSDSSPPRAGRLLLLFIHILII